MCVSFSFFFITMQAWSSKSKGDGEKGGLLQKMLVKCTSPSVLVVILSIVLGVAVLYLVRRIRRMEKTMQRLNRVADHRLAPEELRDAVRYYIHTNPHCIGDACRPYIPQPQPPPMYPLSPYMSPMQQSQPQQQPPPQQPSSSMYITPPPSPIHVPFPTYTQQPAMKMDSNENDDDDDDNDNDNDDDDDDDNNDQDENDKTNKQPHQQQQQQQSSSVATTIPPPTTFATETIDQVLASSSSSCMEFSSSSMPFEEILSSYREFSSSSTPIVWTIPMVHNMTQTMGVCIRAITVPSEMDTTNTSTAPTIEELPNDVVTSLVTQLQQPISSTG